MTDPFIITVTYKGKPTDFDAQLVVQGYSHKFKVLISKTEVYFEPDEEGLYRAVRMPGQDEKEIAAIDRGLLELITGKIAEILA